MQLHCTVFTIWNWTENIRKVSYAVILYGIYHLELNGKRKKSINISLFENLNKLNLTSNMYMWSLEIFLEKQKFTILPVTY